MKLSEYQISSFQTMIFTWWKSNKRDLPWRHTRDPYNIHVSEVMPQQTQVSRVLSKYNEFLRVFPSVTELAAASTGQVILLWKGLGYNRRAVYLKKTAEEIVQKYNSIYPEEEKKLLDLPGLGIYTVRAILVFAYEKQLAFVDTNIRQIIEVHFFEGKKQSSALIQTVADQLLPIGKAWDWHQALMDYGAIELVKLNRPEQSRRTTSIPFKDTHRFIRGRIMDMVRDQDWEEKQLIQSFQDKYQKKETNVTYNLNNLLQEGLLSKKGTIIQLPD